MFPAFTGILSAKAVLGLTGFIFSLANSWAISKYFLNLACFPLDNFRTALARVALPSIGVNTLSVKPVAPLAPIRKAAKSAAVCVETSFSLCLSPLNEASTTLLTDLAP